HFPDHLVEIAVLADIAIHREADTAFDRMPDAGYGLDRAARRAPLESLAGFPWTSELLCLSLQVSPRHVEADRITKDAGKRFLDGNITATLSERDDHLYLVMHILRRRRIAEILAHRHECIRVLLEEEGWVLVRVMSHLDCVIGKIPADAIDAVHGKERIAAFNN